MSNFTFRHNIFNSINYYAFIEFVYAFAEIPSKSCAADLFMREGLKYYFVNSMQTKCAHFLISDELLDCNHSESGNDNIIIITGENEMLSNSLNTVKYMLFTSCHGLIKLLKTIQTYSVFPKICYWRPDSIRNL